MPRNFEKAFARTSSHRDNLNLILNWNLIYLGLELEVVTVEQEMPFPC